MRAIWALLSGVFTFKFFMSGVFMTIGVIFAYNLVVEIVQETLNFAVAQFGGATASVTNPTITGFAAWFLTQIRLPEAFAIMVSMVSLKFILRKIPFIKW